LRRAEAGKVKGGKIEAAKLGRWEAMKCRMGDLRG